MTVEKYNQVSSALRHGDKVSEAQRMEIIDELSTKISNAVYQAALIYEEAEGMGLIRGNGHHMAQALARRAVDMLLDRIRESS